MTLLEHSVAAIIRVVQEQAQTTDPAACLAWLAAYVALTQSGLSHGFLRTKLDASKIEPGAATEQRYL